MKLPFADKARVDRSKICDYLLAFDHPEGSGKAEFFSRHGFTAAQWQILASALAAHARMNEVVEVSNTKYGDKYRIDGLLSCPDGRSPSVRAIWIVDAGTEAPKLVTAYPAE